MIAPTATTVLRSSVARSCGSISQPILFRAAACPHANAIVLPFSPMSQSRVSRPAPMSTRAPKSLRPLTSPSPGTPLTSSRCRTLHAIRFHETPASKRLQSTARKTDAELDASAAQAAAAKQAATAAPLDWNTFFRLRKARRRWQLGFSVLTCLSGGAGGALFLSTGGATFIVDNIPLDPFVTLGLMTFGFASLGWLLGPSIGNLVFNLLQRQNMQQMAVKEAQFFARIKKHRVDPSASSMGNPVPDFYGEKISSVAGYRQWLKDQRAFNKKRTTFV